MTKNTPSGIISGGISKVGDWTMLNFAGQTRAAELEKYEPLYGLPKRSLDEWLDRNSQLRQQYEKELAAHLRRKGANRNARPQRCNWCRL